MKLTDRLRDFVMLESGRDVPVCLAFDVVLRAFELRALPDVGNYEKIELLAEMFAADAADSLTFEEKLAVVSGAFRLLEPEERPGGKSSGGGAEAVEDAFDFDLDADKIFASFLYDYGLDLQCEQGRLHWKKFIALFSNLSQESPEGQAIYWRTVKIPPRTKYNKEEVEHAKKMKNAYRLQRPLSAEEEQEKAIAEMENVRKHMEHARK